MKNLQAFFDVWRALIPLSVQRIKAIANMGVAGVLAGVAVRNSR